MLVLPLPTHMQLAFTPHHSELERCFTLALLQAQWDPAVAARLAGVSEAQYSQSKSAFGMGGLLRQLQQ